MSAHAPPLGRAFDQIAPHYDERFTYSLLGRLLRQSIWRRFDTRFTPGSRVLDLGCGTGEDALYLATRGVQIFGIDSAAGMVDLACRKARAAGLEQRIAVRHAAIESLAVDGVPEWCADAEEFDGAYSNFGALNCCDVDFASLARGLARRLRAGAPVVLVVMGRLVPFEWFWFLRSGELRKAFRRLQRGGAQWRDTTVRYPTVRALRRAFAPSFRCVRVAGLGFLLPPSYAEQWALRNAGLVYALDRWERRIESVPPVPWLADHYVMELERG